MNMASEKSFLILIFYFITCCTVRSQGQLNCHSRQGCYNIGYSAAEYEYDLKLAANQRDCSSNLTNERARCNGVIQNLNRTCESSVQLKINEAAHCNKQLADTTANMNLNMNRAVMQNVRTTITDLSTETRFCIRLTQSECQGQSSTCFWDASLTVTGQQGKGACLSARFE